MYWDDDTRLDDRFDDEYQSDIQYYHDYIFPDMYIDFIGKIEFTPQQIELLRDIVEEAIWDNLQNVDSDYFNDSNIKDIDFGVEYSEDNTTSFYYSSSILIKMPGRYDDYYDYWREPGEDIKFNNAKYKNDIENEIRKFGQKEMLPKDLVIDFIDEIYTGETNWES